MTAMIVLLLYLLLGVLFAVLVARRRSGGALWDGALSLLLWPLWVPIALAPERPPAAGSDDALARIEGALSDGADSARGTPLGSLLTRDAADQILRQARRIDARRGELASLLTRPELCPLAARQRLERSGDGRGGASARVHLDNIERLQAMQGRDERALEELADLAEAVRSQLLLARMAGFSVDGIGAIVNDLWARIEGLGEAMELDTHDDRHGAPHPGR